MCCVLCNVYASLRWSFSRLPPLLTQAPSSHLSLRLVCNPNRSDFAFAHMLSIPFPCGFSPSPLPSSHCPILFLIPYSVATSGSSGSRQTLLIQASLSLPSYMTDEYVMGLHNLVGMHLLQDGDLWMSMSFCIGSQPRFTFTITMTG